MKEFTATSPQELIDAFARRGITASRVSLIALEHLATDYSDSAGVAHLGYRVVRPLVVVTFGRGSSRQYTASELLVECEEGCLSVDEATGVDMPPTPTEIAQATAGCRERQLIRPGKFVGFDASGLREITSPIAVEFLE